MRGLLALGLLTLVAGTGAGLAVAQTTEEPTVLLDAPDPQRAVRQNGVFVDVECLSAACNATATGTVSIIGGRRLGTLRPVTMQVPEDGKVRFKLGLTNNLRRAIQRHFRRSYASAAQAGLRAGRYSGSNVSFTVTRAGRVSNFRISYSFRCSGGSGDGETTFGPTARISNGRFTLRTTGATATGRVTGRSSARGSFSRTFTDPGGGGTCRTGNISWRASRSGSGGGGGPSRGGGEESLPPDDLEVNITVKATDPSGRVLDSDETIVFLEG